jgi:tetratricopeptide (TPR) repeat protein
MWRRPSCWLGVVSLCYFAPLNALAFQSSSAAPSGPDAKQVERSLISAAQQNPNDFAAQQHLGEFYLQQNRLPLGIAWLEKAEALNPEDYNTGYDLSLAYLNSGDTSKAAAHLRQMIGRHETAELDDLLAEAEEKSGDLKGAATEYYRAAQLDPSEGNIFDLASFLLQHKNYEGFTENAFKFFSYGVEKYPQSAKLMVGLGVTLYTEGRYDEAIAALCKAVDLDPADPRPFQFLGKVSTASPSHSPEIQKRLEDFVRLYPANGPANYYYAMSLWSRSQSQPATDPKIIEALLTKAVANAPDFYEAHFELGILYQDQHKYPEAIREFNRTLSLRPDFGRAHYRLFLIYSRNHQTQLANEHLAKLKQIKQEDAAADAPDLPEDSQARQTAESPR